ncbi:MAG: T9SS type A sorting domain-containing protein [Bacteroidota bacterium]
MKKTLFIISMLLASQFLFAQVPSQPGIPTGDTSLCQGPNTSIYTTTGSSNASSYMWNVIPASAGTFTVNGTSGSITWLPGYFGTVKIIVIAANFFGQTTSDTLLVTINPLPQLPSAPTGPTVICQGSPQTDFVINGAAYATSYQWSLLPITAGTIAGTGATATVAWAANFIGTAKIFARGLNTCGYGNVSDTFYVNVSEVSAQFLLYADTNVLHHYYAVNLASGSTPMIYHWSWGDGTDTTAPYPSHTYAIAGYYNICLDVTTANGCIASYCDTFNIQKNGNSIISVDVIPQGTTAVTENKLSSIIVSPNPAQDFLFISNLGEKSHLRILDFTGKTLLLKDLNSLKAQIDISNLASGMYLVELSNTSGKTVRKFLKD